MKYILLSAVAFGLASAMPANGNNQPAADKKPWIAGEEDACQKDVTGFRVQLCHGTEKWCNNPDLSGKRFAKPDDCLATFEDKPRMLDPNKEEDKKIIKFRKPDSKWGEVWNNMTNACDTLYPPNDPELQQQHKTCAGIGLKACVINEYHLGTEAAMTERTGYVRRCLKKMVPYVIEEDKLAVGRGNHADETKKYVDHADEQTHGKNASDVNQSGSELHRSELE